MSKIENNLSKGNVVKQLMAFMVPYIITNIVQSLYGTVDMIIVGRFCGATGMSAIRNGGMIMGFATNLISGLCVGATVMIGQYLGNGKKDALKKTIGTFFSVVCILAVLFTTVLQLFGTGMLGLIKTPAEVIPQSEKYLFATSIGTIFIFGYNVLSAVMRGMGDSKRPFIFVSIACVINIVLDLILVAGLKMDASGAAIATVVAQGMSMLFCIIYLIRNKFVFDFKLSSFRIHKESFKMLMKVGIPTSFQNLLFVFSAVFSTSMVNSLGVTASAAVGAAGQFYSFGVMPAIAMSVSVAAMAAQNLGAGEEKRAVSAVKYGFLVSGCISLVVFTLTQSFPHKILGIFTDDPEIIEMGVSYLRFTAFDFLIVPLQFSLDGLFIGAGHTLFSFINNVTYVLAIRVPVAYVMAFVMGMGIKGIGIGHPVASAISTIAILCFYTSGRWKKNNIV